MCKDSRIANVPFIDYYKATMSGQSFLATNFTSAQNQLVRTEKSSFIMSSLQYTLLHLQTSMQKLLVPTCLCSIKKICGYIGYLPNVNMCNFVNIKLDSESRSLLNLSTNTDAS